jgi:hypothetical protein
VTRTLYKVGEIRNPEKYLEAAQRRRTERFNHCFPRGISFGDIDSFVEVNKRFLILEWKVDSQELATGQRLALTRLAAQPNTTVWVIWTDEAGAITHGRDMGALVSRRGPVTEERVAEAIREWVAGTWVSPAANTNTAGDDR